MLYHNYFVLLQLILVPNYFCGNWVSCSGNIICFISIYYSFQVSHIYYYMVHCKSDCLHTIMLYLILIMLSCSGSYYVFLLFDVGVLPGIYCFCECVCCCFLHNRSFYAWSTPLLTQFHLLSSFFYAIFTNNCNGVSCLSCFCFLNMLSLISM